MSLCGNVSPLPGATVLCLFEFVYRGHEHEQRRALPVFILLCAVTSCEFVIIRSSVQDVQFLMKVNFIILLTYRVVARKVSFIDTGSLVH